MGGMMDPCSMQFGSSDTFGVLRMQTIDVNQDSVQAQRNKAENADLLCIKDYVA